MKKFNEEDIRRFYRWLGHRSDEYTELRIIPWPPGSARVEQYWVQDEKNFIKWCKKWNGRQQIYVGINPRRESGVGEDKDVPRVAAIPFDVDSPHPKKEAATDEELAQAKKRMIELVSWMRLQGYNMPLVAMSGNGYHVIQKTDIPVDEDLPHKLEAYFHEAPTEGMDSIFNLSRIIKVPGTLSIKGVPTEERPHRLSHIVNEGDPNSDVELAKHINELKPYVPAARPYLPPPITTPGVTKKRRTGSLKPCFKRFAEEGGRLANIGSEDNLLRLALVSEAHSRGYSRSQIIELFAKADDFDPKITRDKVDHQLGKIAVEGVKVWSCKKIHKHGGCLGETCKRYKKHVAKYIPTPPPDPGQPASPDAFFDGSDRFIPMYLVNYIIETTGENYLLTPITDKGGDITWQYHPRLGIFRPDGVAYIEERAKRLLSDKARKYMIAETVKLAQIGTYIDRDQFKEDLDVIIIRNGVYHFDTEELTEHSPQYHAKAKLPITYNPDAKCPAILKFLGEVIPNDIVTFQEWVGYHLIKQYLWAKILMLVGDGENGKSVLLLLLTAFLGESNVSNVELIELITNRFKKAELYGKLANIAPDLGSDELKSTGRLKSITGLDYIEAAKKHQHPFRFRNYAKLSFSTNKLPRTPDRSRAFFRRWLIVNCPNVFTGENCDPNILDKITTTSELSGMFNWALEGRRRLIDQGHFTRSETADQIQELYEELMDPITAFINNCVNTDDAYGVVPKDDFHRLYYQFCKMKGFTPVLKGTFSTEIKPRIVNLGEGKRKIGKERVYCWTGISMNPDRTRPGCLRCPGYYACISTSNKSKLYKVKYKTPDTLDTLDAEGGKKPQNGLSPPSTGPSAKPPPDVHARTLSTDVGERPYMHDETTPDAGLDAGGRTSSVVQKLISAVEAQGHVIPEWPMLFLERHGVSHDEAVDVVEGLRLAGKLVQRDDSDWEVPSR